MEIVRLRPMMESERLTDRPRSWDNTLLPRAETVERRNRRGYPRADIYENKHEVIVVVELPGVSREDVKITFNDSILTIQGEKKPENNANLCVCERRFGKFGRSFHVPIPVETDRIDAKFKNGVLRVTMPKAEEAKPEEIRVSDK